MYYHSPNHSTDPYSTDHSAHSTIVSAFVTGINKKKNMDISHYIECGKKLLRLPVPKIIFIESEIYDTYLLTDYESKLYPFTEFVFIDPKRDIYLYTFLSHITNFQINTLNPDKDTIDYLFVQCNKTEWVRQAIYRNTFHTKQFTWIDFGIYHIVKNDAQFNATILKISQTRVKKVAVGSCWNLRLPFVRDIYKDVAWFFAGGIFGGEPKYLLEFADLVQQKCIEYITIQRSFIWETNIWYLVYKSNMRIFSPYLAEHDVSLLQNYGNTTDSIVLVSAVFLETIEKKTVEQLYQHLYFLADIRCPLILFIDVSFPMEIRDFIRKTYPDVYLSPLGDISFPWNSPLFLETTGIHLPSSRNLEKDTLAHMWNMHSKPYCLAKALDIYPHNPFSFLWIDYDISDICGRSAQTFLYELSVKDYLNFPLSDQMIIPGCWSKISSDTFSKDISISDSKKDEPKKDENSLKEAEVEEEKTEEKERKEKQTNFLNNIYWRFCGNVLWGNPLAIRKFRGLYDKYFRKFLRTNSILTWEVNFWAYLETMDLWNPIWYSADHNDSLFYIYNEFICSKLGETFSDPASSSSSTSSETNNAIITKIEYPAIFGKNYKPMSASYLFIPATNSGTDSTTTCAGGIEEGKHYLNTRFVNYHVMENGYYWWPEEEGRTIRNKNICSELSLTDNYNIVSISYREMKETEIPSYKMEGCSEGIEDIRLFYGNGTDKDDIRFIGSTFSHSPNQKIQMITGKYDILLGELKDTFIVDAPNADSWCEKNWIPISFGNDLYFIYKWCPLEIGKIVSNDSSVSSSSSTSKKLEIQIRHETNHFVFRNIRGSSCFISEKIEGIEGFVGVVHYSEDRCPTRHYFHRLVLLDKTDLKPLKYTDAFYFCNLSVEFCIGFGSFSFSNEKEEKYVFWISQKDRDPLRIIIDKINVPKWNTCGKWGL